MPSALRKLVLPAATALLIALVATTLIAGGGDALDGVKDFHAIGAGPSFTFPCTNGTGIDTATTATGTLRGEPVGHAQYILALGDNGGRCKGVLRGEPTVPGTLTLTKENGSVLVMDVALEFAGSNAAFGTYTAPSVAGGSTNKFQGVSGAGSLVVGSGTSSSPSTLHIAGVLVFPDAE